MFQTTWLEYKMFTLLK